MKIGENITFYRKQRGLTQAELGRLVGVSSQAVSKWESGGAPDTEMLPTVAQALGITIDTLFGREQEKTENIEAVAARWLSALPKERRIGELYRMLTRMVPFVYSQEKFSPSVWQEIKDDRWIQDSCFMGSTWVRSAVEDEEGLLLGVNGKNFPMYLLLPEPEGGYAQNLAAPEDYRKLFSALAMPGALELVLELMAKKRGLYSVGALTKLQAGAEGVLDALTACGILRRTEIGTEEGPLSVYALSDNCGMVPLLYMARWVMDESDFWSSGYFDRKRPILEGKL